MLVACVKAMCHGRAMKCVKAVSIPCVKAFCVKAVL